MLGAFFLEAIMALTVTPQRPFEMSRGEDDGIRIGTIQITFDSSYPTGGEAIAASDINSGFSTILGLVAIDYNAAGALWGYNYCSAAGKIFATVADVEDGNATDLSANVVTFLYVCV